MASVDEIIGIAMIFGFTIATGIIITVDHFNSSVEREVFMNRHDIINKHSTGLNTLMETTLPSSQREFGEFLGSSVYYGQKEFNLTTGKLDVEKNLKVLLDEMLGNRPYFFRVEPTFTKLNLIFILDITDSLELQANVLAKQMDYIMNNLTLYRDYPELEVTAEVYVLDEYNITGPCDNFTINCTYFDRTKIYYNNNYSLHDLAKYSENLVIPQDLYNIDMLWKSDWETATSSVIMKKEFEKSDGLNIYFPMSDSLPLAHSFYDSCPIDIANDLRERDNAIYIRENVIVNPTYVSPLHPVKFCRDNTMEHMHALIEGTRGTVFIHAGHFGREIDEAIRKNMEKSTIIIGEEKEGNVFSLTRDLPMPNGEMAEATLKIY